MVKEFHGAKAAVFVGGNLLIYQRDRGIRWPGYWDFPGGGREGDEQPKTCLKREVFEEFGLTVPDCSIVWGREVPAMLDRDALAWFFVIQLPPEAEQAIRFGIEGRRWALLPPSDVANMPNLVPALRDRLTLWLHARGGDPI